MLVLFRIFFTGLFLWLLGQLARSGQGSISTDLASAGWFASTVVVGIAAACTWAPVVGSAVAGPMTGMLTDGTAFETKGGRLRWIYWALRKGYRRLALMFCFVRGVWEPKQPAAFVLGMDNAPAGSWLEKVFAREVWRFSNTQNCLRSYDILLYRHGITPAPHEQTTINMALSARLQTPKPPTPVLPPPPPAPLPPLKRHQRIRLFKGADHDAGAKG